MAVGAEVEIYRSIIAVLLLVCVFLFWRLEKLKRAARESGSLPRPSSERNLRHFTVEVPTSAAIQESSRIERDASQSEPEQEYTFEDPDFALPPIEPSPGFMGRVEGEHGDAIYGGEARYFKDDYLGRVSRGAELELRDCRVYRNEFELNIIKVRVIRNEWESEIGKIGWVGLDDTSFRSSFDPEKRVISV